MAYLRRITTRRLLALCAAVLTTCAGLTAIALAATSGGPVPAPKPLAQALHDALAAPALPGVSARITFTNRLVDSSLIQGADPLLTGASGRLWAAGDKLRIELQSDGGAGDSQLVLHGRDLSVYDANSGTVYRVTLPPDRRAAKDTGAVPSLARIQSAIANVGDHADLSGAQPTDVAGRPAYSVRVSPRQAGGMVGGAELAWDAVYGEPLRAALYARGSGDPVLELAATGVSVGAVPAGVFDVAPPAGAKVVQVTPPSGGGGRGNAAPSRLPFALVAPAALAGMQRSDVKTAGHGAAITYGQGPGAIVVFEQPVTAAQQQQPQQQQGDGEGGGLALPTVRIGALRAQELATPIGTIVRFERGGVAYTVAGSVPPAVAEAAARGL